MEPLQKTAPIKVLPHLFFVHTVELQQEPPDWRLGYEVNIGGRSAPLRAKLVVAREIEDAESEARLWAQLERRFRETHAPAALSGTVLCKVDAGYGAVRPGDPRLPGGPS